MVIQKRPSPNRDGRQLTRGTTLVKRLNKKRAVTRVSISQLHSFRARPFSSDALRLDNGGGSVPVYCPVVRGSAGGSRVHSVLALMPALTNPGSLESRYNTYSSRSQPLQGLL